MMSVEEMYAQYQAMNTENQNILRISAIIFEPFQTTQMVDIIQKYTKRSVDNVDIKNRQKLLVKDGYLQTVSHQYQCNKIFADYLLDVEFRQNKAYRDIGEVVQNTLMLPYWYGFQGDVADRYMRDLRIAYYNGVQSGFKESFLRLTSMGHKRYDHESVIAYFLPETFDKAKLEFATPDIRAFLLILKLNDMSNELTEKDEYFQYAVDFVPKVSEMFQKPLGRKLLQLAFLRGEFGLYDTVAPHIEPFGQLFFKGWHQILRGSIATSLEYYAASIKSMRQHESHFEQFGRHFSHDSPNCFGRRFGNSEN
jgi:hypothetical protein